MYINIHRGKYIGMILHCWSDNIRDVIKVHSGRQGVAVSLFQGFAGSAASYGQC